MNRKLLYSKARSHWQMEATTKKSWSMDIPNLHRDNHFGYEFDTI